MKKTLVKPSEKNEKATKVALSGLFGGTHNECTVTQTNCVPGCSCAPSGVACL